MSITIMDVRGEPQLTSSALTERLQKNMQILMEKGMKQDNVKLATAEMISKDLDYVIFNPAYSEYPEPLLKCFSKVLMDVPPQNIAELSSNRLRKLCLDLIHRIPRIELPKSTIDMLITLCFGILEHDNEQNAVTAGRIIHDLILRYRPPYNGLGVNLVRYAGIIYKDFQHCMNELFRVNKIVVKKDLSEIGANHLRNTICFPIVVEYQKGVDASGNIIRENITILPKAILSVKVKQEFPLHLLAASQVYKTEIKPDICQIFPNVLRLFFARPSNELSNDSYDKEGLSALYMIMLRLLSFMAFLIKHDPKLLQAVPMVDGEDAEIVLPRAMIKFVQFTCNESNNLRKDLFIAFRYVFGTDLKLRFEPHIDVFLNLNVLFGDSYSSREMLRPLIFSTLGDFFHYMRAKMSYSTALKVIDLFSQIIHDDLQLNMQGLCNKLMLNFIESMTMNMKREDFYRDEDNNFLDLPFKLLKMCVIQFKVIVKQLIPALKKKIEQLENPERRTVNSLEDDKSEPLVKRVQNPFLTHGPQLSDTKNLLKWIVCVLKTVSFAAVRQRSEDVLVIKSLVLPQSAVKLYVKAFKWGVRSFDVYTLQPLTAMQRAAGLGNLPRIKSAEETEAMTHFTGVFVGLNHISFREVLTESVVYFVERVPSNANIMQINEAFLATRETVEIYSIVMVEFLVERLKDMGDENQERSDLYLKLFKSVFDNATNLPEGEVDGKKESILKPYLQKLVNSCMDFSMVAKEPYNYFSLMRSLFRSIGGGNHDSLYHDFLALLPNVLHVLNSLQSGSHNQNLKDLFVELCLTVPVRLSSLLPYLPTLMDPLVSALNGSPTLISQGLRTLELCVDNLQPDFLYDHITPVRGDLIQCLWKCLHNKTDQVAQTAFRLLGKLGGNNRRMLNEPQKLEYYSDRTNDPAILVRFAEYQYPVHLSMRKIIETAVKTLKKPATDLFYRQQAWDIVHAFLLSTISTERHNLFTFFSDSTFTSGPIPPRIFYKYPNEAVRNTHVMALTGLFMAVATKDMPKLATVRAMAMLVRHYTMIAIAQQAGPVPLGEGAESMKGYMDPFIMADAIVSLVNAEDKECWKSSKIVMSIILGTAESVMGSVKRASELPFMDYLSDQLCNLCYEKPWYAKFGGSNAIQFLFKKMSMEWVYRHLYTFVRAQLFVMADLSNEVCNGAIDHAKKNLDEIVTRCAVPTNYVEEPELAAIRTRCLFNVTEELIKLITCPNDYLRKEVMHLLRLYAEIQNRTMSDVMSQHKNTLADMLPLKKHLLRQQAPNTQIGLMEGYYFCATVDPAYFALDLNTPEHRNFFNDVMFVCESPDALLTKPACYKNLTKLLPLRTAALKVISVCYNVPEVTEKVFMVLFETTGKEEVELQLVGHACMKTFVAGSKSVGTINSIIDLMINKNLLRSLLVTFCGKEVPALNYGAVLRLSLLANAFPTSFNEKLCCPIIVHMKRVFTELSTMQKEYGKTDKIKGDILVALIEMYSYLPTSSRHYILNMCMVYLSHQKMLMMGPYKKMDEALMKYLLQYPVETASIFVHEDNLHKAECVDYFLFVLNHKDGINIRRVLEAQEFVDRLIEMLDLNQIKYAKISHNDKIFIRNSALLIIHALNKHNDQWIAGQSKLANKMLHILTADPAYLEQFAYITKMPYHYWNEPKKIVQVLLNYFTHHSTDTEFLFKLITVFCYKFQTSFKFFKDFLEKTVTVTYTAHWKCAALQLFCEKFRSNEYGGKLKPKLLKYLLLPSLAYSFEHGEAELVMVGTKEMQRRGENLVDMFCHKLVDYVRVQKTNEETKTYILQLACLLVEFGPLYFANPDSSNTRSLLDYIYPECCNKKGAETVNQMYEILLACRLMANSRLPRNVVVDTFVTLLKTISLDLRNMVRNGFDILMPVITQKIENGFDVLVHWTRTMLIEETQVPVYLLHISHLIVRQYKFFYPVRHKLLVSMLCGIHRLFNSHNVTLENKKTAVELGETFMKWELRRIELEPTVQNREFNSSSSEITSQETVDMDKIIPKYILDAVFVIMAKLAIQYTDNSSSQGEILSRRSMNIFRVSLKSEIWMPVVNDYLWLEKILIQSQLPNPNYGNICLAIEFLNIVCPYLSMEDTLEWTKNLQNGICMCLTSASIKLQKNLMTFLMQLFKQFPVEQPPGLSPRKELDKLYMFVTQICNESLLNHDKMGSLKLQTLQSVVSLLRAVTSGNETYIDRFMPPFVKVLQRYVNEHLSNPSNESYLIHLEMLMFSLELLKGRISVMKVDVRKAYLFSILGLLMEKCNDVKLMRYLLKFMEEWIDKNTGPSILEKSTLLLKMMRNIEMKFPDLQTQYLELIYRIYKDEMLKITEFTSKLQVAYLWGLRHRNAEVRQKLFSLMEMAIQKRLMHRLLYMFCSQNWEGIGQYFWPKICIELIFTCTPLGTKVNLSEGSGILPGITELLLLKSEQNTFKNVKEESLEEAVTFDPMIEMYWANEGNYTGQSVGLAAKESLDKVLTRHSNFLNNIRRTNTTYEILRSISQLLYEHTDMAHEIWLNSFPQYWITLTDKERLELSAELGPFLTSGSHTTQKDSNPNPLHTIYEALSLCEPPFVLKPPLMVYLGKNHNLWHRVTMQLENMVSDNFLKDNRLIIHDGNSEVDIESNWSSLNSLMDMYTSLGEEDMLCAIWQKHHKMQETAFGLALEQQGNFTEALEVYEGVIFKSRNLPISIGKEANLWKSRWERCMKELNQWDSLLDYAKAGPDNPSLLLETAWRIPDWNLMHETMNRVEVTSNGLLNWKEDLYKGYICMWHNSGKDLHKVERCIESATSQCIREWRQLPRIVSYVHIPLLQGSQQIIELQEALSMQQSLIQSRMTQGIPSSDVKGTIKTWCNRSSAIFDDLSHWSNICRWRQLHYQAAMDEPSPKNKNMIVVGAHALAQSIIGFSKIARKQNLVFICLETLNSLYAIPNMTVLDCFQKIRQHVKALIQASYVDGMGPLREGVKSIDTMNTNYLSKEMKAECLTMKGLLCSKLGLIEEADRCFSKGIEECDSLVKNYALWGDFIEEQFMKSNPRDMEMGASAMACFASACRNQLETKCRKYIAKILWLITFDDESKRITNALDKCGVGITPNCWLPWIPQLLTCLSKHGDERNGEKWIHSIIMQLARHFPQAVYFPIRTMYFTQKMEQRERHGKNEGTIIKATPAMYRSSRIMQQQRELHPTILLCLEGIVDQMVWFRENWYEDVERQLKMALAKCYGLAFETRDKATTANISQSITNFLKKLGSTFGTGLEGFNAASGATPKKREVGSGMEAAVFARTQKTINDPIFQKMKFQFTQDFDFSKSGATNLHAIISKLKKWIQMLEEKISLTPKHFLMEDKCRFLSNFSLQTAEIELPGEFLLPRVSRHAEVSNYFVRIARFLPRVEIVVKHHCNVRRIHIRGNNGRVYAYLIMPEGSLGDGRQQETVLQLLRMINHYLSRQKETGRRFVSYTVPRVVAIAPQWRLVEDNRESLSLLDVCKQMCVKNNVQYDNTLVKYYERLSELQRKGGHTTYPMLKEFLKEMQLTHIPPNLLKNWALGLYKTPMDYYSFRKVFTLQLAMCCFAEYVFHLTRMNPDMMYIHRDNGLINVAYFKFDVDDAKGALDGNRPVPFRLTSNLCELITELGIMGPFTAAMLASAKCLTYPNFKLQSILKAILRDDMYASYKRKMEEETLCTNDSDGPVPLDIFIPMVENSVNSIIQRINSMTVEQKVSTLVKAAKSPDNLCRMDPAWHPWL